MKYVSTKVKLDNLKVVPEETIVFCASQFINEQNSFKDMLETAHEFRLAGLTPIYLCTSSLKDVYVTTHENINKNYH